MVGGNAATVTGVTRGEPQRSLAGQPIQFPLCPVPLTCRAFPIAACVPRLAVPKRRPFVQVGPDAREAQCEPFPDIRRRGAGSRYISSRPRPPSPDCVILHWLCMRT